MHLPPGPFAEDLTSSSPPPQELGFTERTRSAAASQVIGRLLIQTGRRLDALTDNDFDDLLAASAARHGSDKAQPPLQQRRPHRPAGDVPSRRVHRRSRSTRPACCGRALRSGCATPPPALRGSFVAYLDRFTATHSRGTVTGTATRLNHFAAHLAAVDPELASLAELDRRRHIETYLTATAEATNSRTGAPIQASERRGRVLAVHCLLNDIAEWGWPEAPAAAPGVSLRHPQTAPALPRYLTPDLDRRLTQALQAWPDRLPADALLLQRATGLRIGELVDLELDSVHEIPGQGAWLKVPLGKLNTERMVPLDEETVALIDRIVAHRSPGRPLPHPRTARPTDFLFTHHGRRLTVDHLRDVLTRVTTDAGLPHITPHQLRHTYATALVNAGVSLQSLMALLGPRLGRDEPALRTAVRRDRPHRIRAGLDRRESPPGHLAHRATAAAAPHCRSSTATGKRPRRSRPASPAASASAPRSKARAPTPTSASTAPTSAPTPATYPSWPLNAPTPKPWPVTPKPAAGPAKPNATAGSSNASTPTSVRRRPDDTPTTPPDTSKTPAPQSFSPGQPVTFDEVAARTGLGRATLYRNPDLRDHRRGTPHPRQGSAHPVRAHHRDRPPAHRAGRPRRPPSAATKKNSADYDNRKARQPRRPPQTRPRLAG